MDNMNGLDPKYLALIQAGLGILAGNNGRQPAGAAIGQGLLGGVGAYQDALMQQQFIKRQNQQFDMQNQQFDWQKQQREDQKAQRESQRGTLGNIATQYGLDPNVLSAFPSVAEDLIKSKMIPKPRKLAFAPNGYAYDENNPDIVIGGNYGKQDDNKPVNGYLVPDGNGGWKIDPVLYKAEQNMKKSGASNTSISYGSPMAGVDANGNPVFFQPSKNGGAPSIVPGVKPQPTQAKAPTEGQAKAATFYSQMRSASNELDKLSDEGYDPSKFSSQVETSIATGLGNNFVSPTAQQARQAQNQWAESFLRIKTGAAATKDEIFQNVETFFPKPGDSAKVIEQKARMRKQAENDVAQMTQDPANIISKGEKMPEPNKKKSAITGGGWSATIRK